MIKRIAGALLGGLHLIGGLYMLLAGERWYTTTTGVAATGPYNAHFVADVAVAFIAAGLALLARSWRARYSPAAVAGSAFLIFHALIHVAEFTQHPHDLRSTLFIAVLAALALWAALPTKGESRA